MPPVTHSRVVYEGDDNPKVKQIGLAVMGLGALVMLTPFLGLAKDIGAFLGAFFFGFITLMVGGVTFRIGATKRTVPCPHCRVGIAPSASICPQCHMATTAQGVLARRA